MSIVGIGFDLVDIEEFAAQLGQLSSRFTAAAFTASERSDLGPLGSPGAVAPAAARRFAARFAAKEAFFKAWSASRFAAPPSLTAWELRHVEIVNDLQGRPAVRLHGPVAAAVECQLGWGWVAHVALSHDGPVAGASVVIETIE
jgi:holo-[acyl-carrier protein] synthase